MNDLMPLPKRVTYLPGYYRINDHVLQVGLPECANGIKLADAITAGIPGNIGFDSSRADLALHIDEHEPALTALGGEIRRQAYVLKIGPAGMVITGADSQGVYYGWLTLQQLMRRHGSRLPACRIVDWPDLAWRGVHLDLFMHTPTFKALKDLVVKLAGYKVNSLCLEYDDRFRFERHPLVSHPAAYTKDQLRELIKLAGRHFMDVVPLLDSLGHAEQYLRHKPYAPLRELPEQIHEMCPSNPQTLAFMQELLEEVLEVHASAVYAHISGDEVFRLNGMCPRCVRQLGQRPKAALFTAYYRKLSAWIKERGKKPIIWSDMLIKCPEDLDNFPKDIIVQDWCYQGVDRRWWDRPYIKWHPLFKKYGSMLENGETCSKAYNSIARCDKALLDRYWVQSCAKGRYYPFPHVRFLQDNGFSVIGASAASDEASRIIGWPAPARRFANAKRFAEVLKKEGAVGLVNTFWSSLGAVPDAWFGFAAGADFAWHVRDEKEPVFAKRFARQFLNAPGRGGRVIRALDCQIHEGRDGYQSARKYQALVKAAGVAAEDCAWLSGQCQSNAGYGKMLERAGRINLRQVKRIAGKLQRAAPKAAGRFKNINLKSWMNGNFNDCGATSQSTPLSMQPGRHVVGEVPFTIVNPPENNGTCLIIMRGGLKPRGLDAVRGLRMAGSVDYIYIFLTGYNIAANMKYADMIAHYENGWEDTMEITGGVSLADWSGNGAGSLSQAMVGWTHENGRHAYMTWWRNPCPKRPLHSLEIVSSQAAGYIILLGMTARMRD